MFYTPNPIDQNCRLEAVHEVGSGFIDADLAVRLGKAK